MIGDILLGLYHNLSSADENHQSVVSDQPEFEPATSQWESHTSQLCKLLGWQFGKSTWYEDWLSGYFTLL